VERVQQQLKDEEHEKDRGDLEEQAQVDAMPVARPCKRKDPAATSPSSAPDTSAMAFACCVSDAATNANSMPSRVIISSVKRKTPSHAARPVRRAAASRRSAISLRMRRAALSM
jgi:hypothetical protein